MPVSTLTQPDFTNQNPSLYKTALDDSASVLKRVAAAFAPHQMPTATMEVAVDPGMVLTAGAVTNKGGFMWGTLNGTAVVTGLPNTAGLSAGMLVTLATNPGHQPTTPTPPFPANTKILSVDSATQVTLDNAATMSGSFNLIFSQVVGPITAPVGNPRIDLIVYNSTTGVASVVTGTPAPAPVAPAIPAGSSPIGEVLVQTASTTITNSMITDGRSFPTDTAPTIIGGTIDGATIGGTTPAPGTFTDLKVTETLALSPGISPTGLTGTINDWNPTGLADATVIWATASGGTFINGIAGGVDGRILVIHNISASSTINFVPEAGASVAANRIITPNAATYPAYQSYSVILQYDGAAQRWRFVAVSVGGASTARAGLLALATGAQVTTGTSTTLAVAPGTMRNHLGVEKAWVNFNGTGTLAVRASYNVSSVTDVGTGDYRLNFATAMTDANYAFAGTSTQYVVVGCHPSEAPTTTTFRIKTDQSNTAAASDSTYICVQIAGN